MYMNMNRVLTVDPRKLAHCRMCYEPMFCIYDQSVRDFCHDCSQDPEEDAVEAIAAIH